MKIGIIGTGYVGLIQALGLAKIGFEVICLDIDEKKINDLKAGKAVIYEPGLEEILAETKGKIEFTTDYKDLNNTDIIFVAVGTPQDKTGKTNLEYIYAASSTLKQNLENPKIVVIKSTVPVGTNKKVKEILGEGYEVISNPEFLREGKALDDFFAPDRVVVGFESLENKNAIKKIRELYSYFIEKEIPYIETTWATSELIKYAGNSFLATKISFINELSQLADKLGADIDELALGIGLDKRIGKQFLNAGLGYGGSCFPKDVKSLIHQFRENALPGKIISSVDETNDSQMDYFLGKIVDFYDDLKGKKLLVLGLAFKPETDDIRDSRGILLIEKLAELGSLVMGFDPLEKARENTKIFYPEINVLDNIENISGVDGIIISTEYKEFIDYDWNYIKNNLSIPVIFDGRNILDKDEITKIGFIYKKI